MRCIFSSLAEFLGCRCYGHGWFVNPSRWMVGNRGFQGQSCERAQPSRMYRLRYICNAIVTCGVELLSHPVPRDNPAPLQIFPSLSRHFKAGRQQLGRAFGKTSDSCHSSITSLPGRSTITVSKRFDLGWLQKRSRQLSKVLRGQIATTSIVRFHSPWATYYTVAKSGFGVNNTYECSPDLVSLTYTSIIFLPGSFTAHAILLLLHFLGALKLIKSSLDEGKSNIAKGSLCWLFEIYLSCGYRIQ